MHLQMSSKVPVVRLDLIESLMFVVRDKGGAMGI